MFPLSFFLLGISKTERDGTVSHLNLLSTMLRDCGSKAVVCNRELGCSFGVPKL